MVPGLPPVLIVPPTWYHCGNQVYRWVNTRLPGLIGDLFYDRIQASASYARREGLGTQGLGTDVRCGAAEAGTGGAGYSRVHRGNEPRGIARGCEGLSVPEWCGLNPEIAG